uniref:Uncharacterized protein n=1 Tax=Onchocerca volvulus TaxID=6282 RepID=A0A8R1TRA3_ONCVO
MQLLDTAIELRFVIKPQPVLSLSSRRYQKLTRLTEEILKLIEISQITKTEISIKH